MIYIIEENYCKLVIKVRRAQKNENDPVFLDFSQPYTAIIQL